MLTTLRANAHCVMCRARLSPGMPSAALLCGLPSCAARYAWLALSERCAVCGRPLEIGERSSGVCALRECRDTWLVRRPLAERGALALQEEERALELRTTEGERLGLSPVERRSYRLTIIPINDDVQQLLPAERRAAFEGHLRRVLSVARERLDAARDQGAELGATRSFGGESLQSTTGAHRALVESVCVSCRGACCRRGGDHAFLDAERMQRYLVECPDDDDETIIARYLAHIGDETMTHGCVFQRENGCSLASTLRADVCGRFYCDAFARLREPYVGGEPVRAFFIHRGENGWERPRFIEMTDA